MYSYMLAKMPAMAQERIVLLTAHAARTFTSLEFSEFTHAVGVRQILGMHARCSSGQATRARSASGPHQRSETCHTPVLELHAEQQIELVVRELADHEVL